MLCVGTFTAPEGASITVRDKETDRLANLYNLADNPIGNPIIAKHSGTQSAVQIHPAGVYRVIIQSDIGRHLISYDVFAVEDSEGATFATLNDFEAFVTETRQPLPITQGGTGATNAGGAWAALIADAGIMNVQRALFGTPMPEFNDLTDCNMATRRGYHKALVSPLNAPYRDFGACLLRVISEGFTFTQDISQGVKSVSGRVGITGRWWRTGAINPSLIEHPVTYSNWRLG